MIDSVTKRPIEVSEDASDNPQIVVQADQLQDVKGVLDQADIRYAVDEEALRSEGVTATHVIKLSNVDTKAAQAVLDEAAVKVSIHTVDDGLQVYFEPQSLIERYESLLGRYEGNELVHKLFTDDRAAPARVIVLEGQRPNGGTFRVSLGYDSRGKRRR